MSNAMRFGKRALVGVAAGALAAGTVTFAATAPASAAAVTATSIAFQWPSATAVANGIATDDTILFPILAFDAGGVQITGADTLAANQRVDVVVTKPSFVTDDSVGFGFANTGYTSIAKNVTTAAAPSAANLGLSGIGLTGFSTSPAEDELSWEQAINLGRAGTYSITASLVNTGSGAVISQSTATFQLVADSGAPAATVTYLNGIALEEQGTVNPINRLGTTTATISPLTTAAEPDSFAAYLTDAKGGPYIINDDSVYVTNGGTADDSYGGGWTNAATQTGPGVYKLAAAFDAWGAPGTATITTTVYKTSATAANAIGSAALPVEIAGVQAGNVTTAPDAILANTLSYYVEDDVYQVPSGTTDLDFTILTSNSLSDTTLQWDAWANVNGGVLTPSGGRIAMTADAGSLSLKVSANATAADDTLALIVGPNAATQDTVQVIFADPAAALDSSPGIAKVGDAATIPGTITDQFGRALPGTWTVSLRATNSTSATVLATATADASGAFTITAPASASPATASTATFYLFATNGLGTPTSAAAPVTYTATGGVSSLTLNTPATISGVTATVRPLIRVPANGTAVLSQTAAVAAPTTVYDDTIVNAASQALLLQATVSPSTVVTFSGSDGVLFTDRSAGSIFYANATATYAPSSASETPQVYAIATKPGLHTVTATAGTSTATYTFYAQVASNAGRTLSVTPTEMTVAAQEFKGIEVLVKDIFDNPVPRNSGIAVTLAGGGALSSSLLTTGVEGKATVFYTAPQGSGNARVDFTGATANWQVADIAGAPVAVRTARTDITVGGTPSVKTIVIVGERTTVKGKPGIRVEGTTTGFEAGSKMVPNVRFPGQSSYEAGSARPTTTAVGDFTWQRKTGKKIYVFFTNEAGDVKSNRVIIPAK